MGLARCRAGVAMIREVLTLPADGFAVIVHPAEWSRLHAGSRLRRWLPRQLAEPWFGLLRPRPLGEAVTVAGVRRSVSGWLIGLALTGAWLRSRPITVTARRVLAAAQLARRLGAGVIGLQGETAVAEAQVRAWGERLGVTVTTGTAMGLAAALPALRAAAAGRGLDLSAAAVGIAGPGGPLGAVCARLLARECGQITLVGWESEQQAALAEAIRRETGLAVRLSPDGALVRILVLADELSPDRCATLPSGAVVLDLRRARLSDAGGGSRRPDLLWLTGGGVRTPGEPPTWGYAGSDVECCWAEAALLALTGRRRPPVRGSGPSQLAVDFLVQAARENRFFWAGPRLAPWRNGGGSGQMSAL